MIEPSDLKGDLHVHSDWSDGRDTIEKMVEAAARRGYEYVCLTDHSVGRGIANGLSVERLLQQAEIVRSLDQRYPIKVLSGSEVDIRADGTLDYSDEVLGELDVVIASVHSAMGQDSSTMTKRVIKAMRNPYVTVIGHPTCRLLGRREAVDMDVEAVLEAAVETGTAMEINGSPDRLDLKDTYVQRAKDMGVALVVNTDSHAYTHLEGARFGVAVARRGWCEPKHILNTLKLEEFLRFITVPKPERMTIFRGRS